MDLNYDDVDIALVVNVEILRQVLKTLSVNGKKWWIACEPAYTLEMGFLTIGYGDPGCVDRLNTIFYKMPILNEDPPLGGPDKLVVLLDSSVVVAEQCGLYREGDCVLEDEIADFEDFLRRSCEQWCLCWPSTLGHGDRGQSQELGSVNEPQQLRRLCIARYEDLRAHMMTHYSETWVPLSDKPQKWWRIVCTYDGKPGCVAAAVGSTADEAKTAFLESLAEPHLAVIEEMSPIGFCEVTDVMEDLWG